VRRVRKISRRLRSRRSPSRATRASNWRSRLNLYRPRPLPCPALKTASALRTVGQQRRRSLSSGPRRSTVPDTLPAQIRDEVIAAMALEIVEEGSKRRTLVGVFANMSQRNFASSANLAQFRWMLAYFVGCSPKGCFGSTQDELLLIEPPLYPSPPRWRKTVPLGRHDDRGTTPAHSLAIRLPTEGLRLFRIESICFHEPSPHDRQNTVGCSHIN
jgi:hypothetical protein